MPRGLDKYETIFVDSISVASRICLQWCKGQPQAMSDRSGKPDLRGAYGLLGQEMIGWLTHLQHTPRKNIWLVGLLDRRLDDFGKPYFAMQIEGSKTGLELPGIVDEVITLAEVRPKDGASVPRLRLHHDQRLRLPGQGPQRAARHAGAGAPRPAHGQDPRPAPRPARGPPRLRPAGRGRRQPHPDDWSMSAMAERHGLQRRRQPGRRLRPDPRQHPGEALPHHPPRRRRPRGLAHPEQDQQRALPQHRGHRPRGPLCPAPHLHPHRLQGQRRGRARRGQLRQPRPRADPGHPRVRRAASGPPTSPRRPASRA